jgi:hypothetical protein
MGTFQNLHHVLLRLLDEFDVINRALLGTEAAALAIVIVRVVIAVLAFVHTALGTDDLTETTFHAFVVLENRLEDPPGPGLIVPRPARCGGAPDIQPHQASPFTSL